MINELGQPGLVDTASPSPNPEAGRLQTSRICSSDTGLRHVCLSVCLRLRYSSYPLSEHRTPSWESGTTLYVYRLIAPQPLAPRHFYVSSIIQHELPSTL